MFITYVIISRSGRRYTGHSPNLEKRLSEHNAGKCKTTKVDTGWRVVYTREFATRGEAMKHERWLKSGAGREYLNRMFAGWSPPQAE